MIDAFRGVYAFLSNFYLCRVTYDGIVYPSAEHTFQAQKTDDKSKQLEVAKLPTPAKAKHYGRRKLKLGSDWEETKVDVMRRVLFAKFTQNPKLLKALVNTGSEILVEGNDWGDRFWGVCGTGSNMLGKLLMELREIARDDWKI